MSPAAARVLRVGRWLVPPALLALVATRVDLHAVAQQLAHVDGRWAAATLALTPLLYICYALRWRFTAARLGVPLGFGRALAEYYASTLLNQLLPLGVAGDIVRALRHHRRLRAGDAGARLGPAARAVVLERLSGVAALMLFVLAAAVTWLARGRRELWPVAALALAVVVAATVAAVWRRPRDVGDDDWRRALVSDGALPRQLALSAAGVLLLIAMFVGAARAVHVVVAAGTALAVVPLMLAATLVPFAFAGWGVREATTAALYRLLGLDAATGVAVAVAFGLVNLAAATPGALVLAATARRPRA